MHNIEMIDFIGHHNTLKASPVRAGGYLTCLVRYRYCTRRGRTLRRLALS